MEWEEARDRNVEVPEFGVEELVSAVSRLACGKAPGPDGIPTEVLRLVAVLRPWILLDLYNACLKEGVFSKDWKTARLVLIDKGKGGDPAAPSSYRPLSLLNTLGKLFEMLLKPRIQAAVREAGDLSDRQHGFRQGRSTVGAIHEVISFFDRAQKKPHKDRPVVLLATLDVRNAFNSARWVDIVEAFSGTFALPSYLLRVVKDYLRDRSITYVTTNGEKTRRLTAGVAQGSILGPDFWNVVYDELLRLPMPPGVYLVAYADDVVVVIVARDKRLAQLRLTRAMAHITDWMCRHGLELALKKTELILLTRRRIETTLPLTVGDTEIRTRSDAKYLGVTLDTKLTYWPHIKRVSERAAGKTAALSRLMTNTRGPRPSIRRLLMAVTHSMLLYGAEVWGGAMRVKKYSRAMLGVQRRGALRIACAYRTVSGAAILVIAGVIPIDLLALERVGVFQDSAENGRARAAADRRMKTLMDWQARWTADNRAPWTKRLIRHVRSWKERRWGEVDFYLTQLLSGHGYFRHYLYRMGKVSSPTCKYCGSNRDDAEHTFFACPRWAAGRRALETVTGRLTSDNIVMTILTDRDKWNRVA